MKKSITRFVSASAVLLFLSIVILSAQTTVTVGPQGSGAEYTSIRNAITGKAPGMEANSELLVILAEGTHLEPVKSNFGWGKALKITVRGAGADKTIIKSPLDAAPTADSPNDRMWQLNNQTSTGSEIIFENLRFKYWGTYGTLGVGGIINIFNNSTTAPPFVITLGFKNVVFEDCHSVSLFNSWQNSQSFLFDNCLFYNCATIVGSSQALQGLISKPTGGNVTIKNSTFMSNKIIAIPSETNPMVTLNGGILNINVNPLDETIINDTRDGKATIILEGNAFINNRVADEAVDSVFSMISFKPLETSVSMDVTMTNNISIGNSREGKTWESDVFFFNDHKINFNNSGNIVNKVIKRTAEGEGENITHKFEKIHLPGFKDNPVYTYTHQDINFEMDGNLPKLTLDSYGVGKVNYTGDGGIVSVNMKTSDPAKIFTFNRTLYVTGLKTGEKVEIYTITGSLFVRSVVTSDAFEMQMPKGIYIVKAGIRTQKVLIY
jgi:hypothetical protein